MDIQKSNYGYPKIELWISKNRIIDIQKSNYGYLKIELWISKNRIIDIQKSALFYDIQNSNLGYP